jgi:hypothetical protein
MKRLVLAGAAALVVIVLVVAQLVLPGIAAQRLRDRLSKSGKVMSVQVSAFPAIELLWHHADHVVVRLGDYRSDVARLGGTLAGAINADSVDASATAVHSGVITLHDATLTKRSDELTGAAMISEADLRGSLPFLRSVVPVASNGDGLVLRGTASVLGLTISAKAIVAAQNGNVVVAPDVPLGGLATLTVFSNRHLYVQSVAASPAPGGFSVQARGQLH